MTVDRRAIDDVADESCHVGAECGEFTYGLVDAALIEVFDVSSPIGSLPLSLRVQAFPSSRRSR